MAACCGSTTTTSLLFRTGRSYALPCLTHRSVTKYHRYQNICFSPFSSSSLKDVPPHRWLPVLKHLRDVGVGRVPRPSSKQRIRRKGRGRGGDLGDVAATHRRREEGNFLARLAREGRVVRPTGGQSDDDDVDDESVKQYGCWWMPPPPFSSSIEIHDERGDRSGTRVRRMPVRIVGRSRITRTAIEDDESDGEESDDDDGYDDGYDDDSVRDERPRYRTTVEFPSVREGLPEVAIAGRSNVGKSTLLNALLYGNQTRRLPRQHANRHRGTPDALKAPRGVKAAVSDRPGETRDAIFYRLDSRIVDRDSPEQKEQRLSLALVDLPGHGFAYASDEDRAAWERSIRTYLTERGDALKRLLLLVDARHGLKAADENFLRRLQETRSEDENDDDVVVVGARGPGRRRRHRGASLPPIQVVLTKCDLVDRKDLARRAVTVRDALSDMLRRQPSALPVVMVSAKAGAGFNNFHERRRAPRGGILELQRELAALVPRSGSTASRKKTEETKTKTTTMTTTKKKRKKR